MHFVPFCPVHLHCILSFVLYEQINDNDDVCLIAKFSEDVSYCRTAVELLRRKDFPVSGFASFSY